MSSFLSTTFSSVPYVLASICFIRVTSLIVLDFKANNGLVSLCLTKKISCNFMAVFEHSLKREVSQTWNRHTNFHLTSHSVIARSLLSFSHSELSYAFTRTTISIECKDFRPQKKPWCTYSEPGLQSGESECSESSSWVSELQHCCWTHIHNSELKFYLYIKRLAPGLALLLFPQLGFCMCNNKRSLTFGFCRSFKDYI